MKKLLSLLLAVVMVFGLLALTVSADDVAMPPECDVADAGVKVTCSGNKDTYTFETLDAALVKWVCATLPGNKTITLTKDLDLSDVTPASSSSCIGIPSQLASWYDKRGGKDTLTIDLKGFTISYTGACNLFFVQRYGVILKNGTIRYTCAGDTRAVMAFGTSTGFTGGTDGGWVWKPEVTFDNVKAFNLTTDGGNVINCHEYAPRITVKNSTLWAAKGTAIRMGKTDQSKLTGGNPYLGDYDAQLTISKSVVGSAGGHPFTTVDEVKIKVGDSALVANKEGMTGADSVYDLDIGAMKEDKVEGWSMEAEGIAMSGDAYTFGKAPGGEPLPFTDVAESDWFYSFVKQMYTKKIISGMTATTFVPNGTLTYGQALKLLVAAIDTDVGNASSGHWASNYLAKAKEKGWVDGDVDLDGKITRLAFCQIAAKAKGLTEQPAANPFTDTTDTAVLALVNAGVINGMSENTFAPANTLTRAQIAKIIALLTAL